MNEDYNNVSSIHSSPEKLSSRFRPAKQLLVCALCGMAGALCLLLAYAVLVGVAGSSDANAGLGAFCVFPAMFFGGSFICGYVVRVRVDEAHRGIKTVLATPGTYVVVVASLMLTVEPSERMPLEEWMWFGPGMIIVLALCWLCTFLGLRTRRVAGEVGGQLKCTECGYNLTGNVSGICPECGTPIPEEARRVLKQTREEGGP